MKKKVVLLFTLLSVGLFPAAVWAGSNADSLSYALERAVATTQLSGARRKGPNNEKLAKQYRPALLQRFLKYIKQESQSQYDKDITPGQIEMANQLLKEIMAMGLPEGSEMYKSEHHYVFVNIPSNIAWAVPVLGFSAHYDVTPDSKAEGINPQVITNYQGGPIVLPQPYKGETQVIDPETAEGAYLKTQIGKTVVTSDGSTLLSADDKSGVAILMTILQTIADNPNKPHGQIQIILAPNEDVGRAAEYVDETPYRPEIAYDFDGETGGEVMIGNFNAYQYFCTFIGKGGHQMHAATNGYRNVEYPMSLFIEKVCSIDPNNSLPLPNYTSEKGYAEPHHAIYNEEGNYYKKTEDFRLRSFSEAELQAWVKMADQAAQDIAKLCGVKAETKLVCNYRNVAEVAHPRTQEVVRAAFAQAGVPINEVTVRAGTTASMFVTKGLVGAYTIFTGQNNPHAPTEWLSEEDMFKAYIIGLNIIDEVVKLGK